MSTNFLHSILKYKGYHYVEPPHKCIHIKRISRKLHTFRFTYSACFVCKLTNLTTYTMQNENKNVTSAKICSLNTCRLCGGVYNV